MRRTEPPSGSLTVHDLGSGPTVVALHGFTLGGLQFRHLAAAAQCSFLAPDLPGHGTTTIEPVDLETTMAALISWLESAQPPLPLVGYSQGGRLALLLALSRPELIERLALISSSPGIRDAAARERRRDRDAVDAEALRSDGLEAFLDRWTASPLTGTRGLPPEVREEDRALRGAGTAAGLAAALVGYGQSSFPFVGDRLGELGMPVLTIAGGADPKYAQLARTMAGAIPQGRVRIVPRAPHNLVLAAPEPLGELLHDFLATPAVDQSQS